MSVGLESNFFWIETFSNFQFSNIDVISGVYKNVSGKQWRLKKLYLSILKGLLESSLRCPEILIGFYREKNYFGDLRYSRLGEIRKNLCT